MVAEVRARQALDGRGVAPVVEVVHMCSGSPPVDDSTACDEWPTEEAKAGRHVALVMPLATRTLSSVIEEGTLSMEDFVSVVRPVVETVAELHRHGCTGTVWCTVT